MVIKTINIINVRETKSDDFTVFWFQELDTGEEMMFRLRKGYGTLKVLMTGKTILSDVMVGFDGVCNFMNIQDFCRDRGVMLNQLV